MSNFLSGLLDRALNQGTVLQRRKPSQFESNERGLPTKSAHMSGVNDIDVTSETRFNSDEGTMSGFSPTQQPRNFRDVESFDGSIGSAEKQDEVKLELADTAPTISQKLPPVDQLQTIRESYGKREGDSPFSQTNGHKQIEGAEGSKIQTAWNFSDSKSSNEALGLKRQIEQDGAESTTNFTRDPLRFEQPGTIREGFVEEWLLQPLGQDSPGREPASPNEKVSASSKLEDANSSQIEITTQKREPVNPIAQSKEPQQAIPVRLQVDPVRVIQPSPSEKNLKINLASSNTVASESADSKPSAEVMLGIKPKRQSNLIHGKDAGAISWPRNQSKSEMSKLDTLEGESNHQPTIHVSIGRIEIRANPSNAPKKSDQQRSGDPTLKLEDYLKQREGGSR